MTATAKLYLRNNGSFGAECDGCKDTGHHIEEDSGRFTVWDLDGEYVIAWDVPREDAERAIAEDWRAAK